MFDVYLPKLYCSSCIVLFFLCIFAIPAPPIFNDIFDNKILKTANYFLLF